MSQLIYNTARQSESIFSLDFGNQSDTICLWGIYLQTTPRVANFCYPFNDDHILRRVVQQQCEDTVSLMGCSYPVGQYDKLNLMELA